MSRIPLRYRLPNPPASFVGRDREVGWLAEAIRSAPLAVVVGPGGLGKTALVLHTLHRRFKKKLDRIVFVPLGPALVGGAAGAEALRALAQTHGVEDIDWAAIADDPDALVESLLDLAEDGSFWVVLDDVHHGEEGDARRLLSQVSRYARQSRWIVTTRMDPRVGDAGHTLHLGALDQASLEKLARAWYPDAPERSVAGALHVSGGSPLLLRQSLATGRTEPGVTRNTLLAELPEEDAELLDALSLLSVPLPEGLVPQVSPGATTARLADLERRGLLERGPMGVRLHDVVRTVLRAPRGHRGERIDAVVGALLTPNDPDLATEAVRVLIEEGRFDAAADVLDERGSDLLAAGHAPRLWRLLENVADERLAGWRLRSAAELGNPTALHGVREPDAGGAQDQLAWAHALYVQGDLAQAGELAGDLYATFSESGEEAATVQAGILVARCLAMQGERGRALRHLQAIPADDFESRALRDAEAAQILAGTPQGEGAVRMADELRAHLGELAGVAREEVAWGAANVYRLQGRLDDAATMLEAVTREAHGGMLALFRARRAAWLRADVDVERGSLERASSALEELGPFIRSASLIRPFVRCTEAMLRLARGDLEGLDSTLRAVVEEAGRFDAVEPVLRAQALRAELAMLEGRALDDVAPGAETSEPAELWRLRTLDGAVRRGELPTDDDDRALAVVDPDHGPLMGAVSARVWWWRGDEGRALGEIAAAVRAAATRGQQVREAEIRDGQCELLSLAGRLTDLRGAAEALGHVASRLASPRFAAAVRFWENVAEEAPRWSVFERLALDGAVSPAVARRSQAMLGGEPDCDRFDREIVHRIAARPGWAPPEPVVAAPVSEGWSPGWGIDPVGRTAWLPDGANIPLARRALSWRLLEVLADHGGQATKEQLVLDAWDEPEYHPLKHDARMQVAIRKLRELIEDDPSSPERLITTEDGYALTGPFRRAIAASANARGQGAADERAG